MSKVRPTRCLQPSSDPPLPLSLSPAPHPHPSPSPPSPGAPPAPGRVLGSPGYVCWSPEEEVLGYPALPTSLSLPSILPSPLLSPAGCISPDYASPPAPPCHLGVLTPPPNSPATSPNIVVSPSSLSPPPNTPLSPLPSPPHCPVSPLLHHPIPSPCQPHVPPLHLLPNALITPLSPPLNAPPSPPHTTPISPQSLSSSPQNTVPSPVQVQTILLNIATSPDKPSPPPPYLLTPPSDPQHPQPRGGVTGDLITFRDATPGEEKEPKGEIRKKMAGDSDKTDSKKRNETGSDLVKLRTPPGGVGKKRKRRKRRKPNEENEDEVKSRLSLFGDPRERPLHFPMIDDLEDDLTSRNPEPDPPPPPPPPASSSSSSSSSSRDTSSSFSLDDIGESAAELAEQLCDVTSEAGHLITKELKEGLEYVTQPEDTLEFGWLDTVTGLVSIVAFYFELVSDGLVTCYLYGDDAARPWFLASLVLLVAPLLIVNGFSFYWYWFDEVWCHGFNSHARSSVWVWAARLGGHVLLQAPVLRQVDIIYYGHKSLAETILEGASVDQVMMEAARDQRRDAHASAPAPASRTPVCRAAVCGARRRSSECFGRGGGYVARWIHAERDATNVELLLALSQAAPLLILNLFIMARTLPIQTRQGHFSETMVVQIFSEWSSLLTLAWSVSSFVRATRLTEPSLSNLSILDQMLLTLGHFCSIVSQVMSFALFASQLVVTFFIVVILHWLFMSCWILVQLVCFPRTTCTRAFFAHDRRLGPCHQLDDVLYSAMMGLVFLFTFVDVGGVKATQAQAWLYQLLIFLEQMLLLSVWLLWSGGTTWYHWLPLLLSPLLLCLNLAFMACFAASVKTNHCPPLAKHV
ncbi:uncharacterized protein LOC135108480 [Scylla paramamosain]|uniref:uncharacterized protein LOC135108480 n=1 Tax=Scylla paramamosain TaxID=85552 RepID=UPI0030834A27